MAKSSEQQERLLEEINRLQQEKRTLNLRLQGVDVLAKVLQDSQEENSKLKQEVIELRGELKDTSLNSFPSRLSLRTTPSMMAEDRCFLSQPEDGSLGPSESFEYVEPNSSLNAGPSSVAMGIPNCNLHIRELSSGFHTIKNESDNLLQEAKTLLMWAQDVKDKSESEHLSRKVATVINRIIHHAKDMKTRETFLQGLANEEEQVKEKLITLGMEQVSQEKVMEELKSQMKDEKEELESIKEEIKFLCEAVVVNKEDASSLENFSSSETASNSSHMSSPTKEKELGALGTPSFCERCPELVQQLNQARKEKEEIIRQKEEILDVNHAWDAQYKKLKTETGKEIADLKQQIQLLKASDVFASATDMVEQEKQAKEKALDDKNKFEEKSKQLQEEIDRLTLQLSQSQKTYSSLQQTPSPFPKTSQPSFTNYNQELSTSSQSAAMNEETPQVKEIEVLKEQLRIYADDFACERQDRERMQSEKEKLESELRELREQVSVLKEQVHLYEEDFRKECQEKDRLRRQLNLQREGADPDLRLNDMTRKAQAVAERQARLRALREQYNREERHLLQDQQDLQQTARVMAIQSESQQSQLHDLYSSRSWGHRQTLHPRGATETQRPSNEMFYGGEVQPDSRSLGIEVIDHADKVHRCPRCFRSFSRDEHDAYRKHTAKCIDH